MAGRARDPPRLGRVDRSLARYRPLGQPRRLALREGYRGPAFVLAGPEAAVFSFPDRRCRQRRGGVDRRALSSRILGADGARVLRFLGDLRSDTVHPGGNGRIGSWPRAFLGNRDPGLSLHAAADGGRRSLGRSAFAPCTCGETVAYLALTAAPRAARFFSKTFQASRLPELGFATSSRSERSACRRASGNRTSRWR